MVRFLAFRILQFPLILAIIYVATFLLAWVAPGDQFEKERKLPPETKRLLEEKFHATSPIQFLTYYPWQIITRGDFGPSLNYQEFSVNDILRKSLPVSVSLGLAAVAIAIVGGVLLGTIAAVKRNGVMDWTSLALALIGVSVPSFVAASMLLSSFAFTRWFGVQLFPLGGWPGGMEHRLAPADTPEYRAMLARATPELRVALTDPEQYFEPVLKRDGQGQTTGFEVTNRSDKEVPLGDDWDELMNHGPRYYQMKTRWLVSFGRYLRHMALPALALSLLPMAYITRLMRVSMIDVLASDYVRTARAKGLSRPKVIVRHCLRNAFLPVLSYIGPAAAATLVGSFVVEKVFNIPGMGDYFVRSVLNRDQTLILGTVMVYSVLLLSLNLFVDVMYSVVDPRIKI